MHISFPKGANSLSGHKFFFFRINSGKNLLVERVERKAHTNAMKLENSTETLEFPKVDRSVCFNIK